MDAYRAALEYLTRLEVSAGWDLKLERMRAAVARYGHPERAWPAVHIAGTNGKGSTAAMVEAILRAAGYRTGLYTSPHLVDFTERMRVNGRTIPREAVVALVEELRAELRLAGIALTHFEFVTLMAFEWFKSIGMPMVCAPVFNHLHHFQSLLRRLGFRKIGIEHTPDGIPTETIYGYFFTEETPNEDPVRTTE